MSFFRFVCKVDRRDVKKNNAVKGGFSLTRPHVVPGVVIKETTSCERIGDTDRFLLFSHAIRFLQCQLVEAAG